MPLVYPLESEGLLPITIVRLGVASTPDLERIDAESNRPPWSQALFSSEFSNSVAVVLGARAEGALVGFIDAHVVLDEAHVVSLGVARAYRRRGVGEALVRGMLDHLYKRAVAWVTLEVRAGNIAARALYERVGFVEAGVRAAYYSDNGEDALTMRLCVPSA